MAPRVLVLTAAAIAVTAATVALASGDGGARSVSQSHRAGCHPSGPGTLVFPHVFLGAKPRQQLQSSRWGDEGKFAKVGLLVHEGESVRLSTPADGPVRLIGWESEAPAYAATVDDSVRPDGVPDLPTTGDCADDWNFYAGGFIFRGKHCTRLTVEADGKIRVVRFGLGKRCRG